MYQEPSSILLLIARFRILYHSISSERYDLHHGNAPVNYRKRETCITEMLPPPREREREREREETLAR